MIGLVEYSGCLASVDGSVLLQLTEADLLAAGLPQAVAGRLLQNIQWLRHGNGRADRPAEDQPVPEEFLCPITREVMRCPVRCQDGFVYEEVAIQGGALGFPVF
jgi:hypothetical protein